MNPKEGFKMLKKMMLCSRQVALLLVIALSFGSVAPAAETIAIAAHKCGPLAALKAAGKSPNLLPFLQHKDGSVVKPSEYRSLSGEQYLPIGAKADAEKTQVAIAAEVKEFGAVKVSADCAKGNCVDVDQLKAKLDEATASISTLREQVALNKKIINGLTAMVSSLETQNRIMWVMLALAFLIGCGLGYMLGRILSAKAVEKAVSEKDAAEVTRDSAQQELKNLSDKWNDIEQVQLRLQQLRTAQS